MLCLWIDGIKKKPWKFSYYFNFQPICLVFKDQKIWITQVIHLYKYCTQIEIWQNYYLEFFDERPAILYTSNVIFQYVKIRKTILICANEPRHFTGSVPKHDKYENLNFIKTYRSSAGTFQRYETFPSICNYNLAKDAHEIKWHLLIFRITIKVV